MRNLKRFWPVRSRLFRSLLILAGVFLLTAALVQNANAQNVLIYFNFEDPPVPPLTYDDQADVQPLYGGDNPGGGVQFSTLTNNFVGTGTGTVAGTLLNRTVGDIDNANPGSALGLRTTPLDNGHWIQFHANTTTFSNMSLSFAVNSAGNGFNSVQLSYIINGVETVVGSQPIVPGGGFQIITFAIPPGAEGQPDVIFRLSFTGGTSQGNNLQTVIDNIQLTGVPEPTTVAGGLLGVLGLCWHQRRRLRLILPRSRRA
jgi:hypothetical protein